MLVTHWNSLVARYSLWNHLLLVAKFARYSLQKLLVAKNHSLLVAEVARCKNHLLLVAKYTRYSLQKLLITKNHSLLIAEVARCKKLLVTCCEQNPGTNGYLKPTKIGGFYLFILYFQLIEKQRKKTEKDSVYNWISITTN